MPVQFVQTTSAMLTQSPFGIFSASKLVEKPLCMIEDMNAIPKKGVMFAKRWCGVPSLCRLTLEHT